MFLFKIRKKRKKNDDFKLVENDQIEMVKKDGLSIKDIKNPSLNTRLEAVKQNGLALKYIDDQTEEICEAAVEQNKDAAVYIIDNALRLRLTEKIKKEVFHPELSIDELIDEAGKKRKIPPMTGGFAEEMKARGR